MKSTKCSTWLGYALWLIACDGETLSVGELRCEGEGVVCERPSTVSRQRRSLDDLPDFEALPEVDVEPEWVTALPCPAELCLPQDTQLVVHGDGSITVARTIDVPSDGGAAGPSYEGVWIGRFDADGTLLGEDASLVVTDGSGGIGVDRDTVLALDDEGQALLGVLRLDDYAGEVSIYRVDESARVERLFRSDGLMALSALAGVEGDVLVAGYYWDGDDALAPNPELARYARDGTLVWRQTQLRRTPAAELSQSQTGLNVAIDVPLVVDSRGRATVAVVDVDTFGLDALVLSIVQVGPDGNVRWAANGADNLDRSQALGPMLMAADAEDRVILAERSYVVSRYTEQADPVTSVIVDSTGRHRQEFWDPDLMGLDVDASNRVLIATRSGTIAEHRVLIDRVSADFARRETFALTNATELESPYPGFDGLIQLEGLRVAPGGAVYVWSESAVARIDLP